jgi:multiple sugar transport system permease protein
MFPAILLGIPMFIIWRQLGLLNSYIGVILAITALSLPFSLWLMWKFFQTIPQSLEESAQVMGTSRFGAFYDIALPMAKPGMMAVAIFSFAVAWNAYTVPKILITDRSHWLLTIAVDSFIQTESINWGPIMAASSLMLIPAFIFVYFLQRYILRGFKAGGIG